MEVGVFHPLVEVLIQVQKLLHLVLEGLFGHRILVLLHLLLNAQIFECPKQVLEVHDSSRILIICIDCVRMTQEILGLREVEIQRGHDNCAHQPTLDVGFNLLDGFISLHVRHIGWGNSPQIFLLHSAWQPAAKFDDFVAQATFIYINIQYGIVLVRLA